ncbi:MAG TPA: hypothetical protein DEA82_01015 [Flavobacteriaceae bacterium]|jgi:hypothetical protein|nr:hypothetical protein [Flavobacteriaceae bacterium]MAY53831.1 hypothetical protein [Flavobacteriaceae bacterium]HBR52823.1 hypothetical protein [Flavobacteriaceae bacterium]|tara:strand:+ start:75389 stop:75913 length:525 start_codon:yes stop_codon:yes gene_type:complete
MKKITLFALSCLLFMACSKEAINTSYNDENNGIDRIGEEPIDPIVAGSTELIAGQHIDVGTVTVSTTLTEGVVTYETSGDWVLIETHLYVGSIENLPSTGSGNPKIGHFPLDGEHDNDTTTVSYTIGAIAAGTCEYVFAHAVVQNTVTGQEETAWANGLEAAGNNWAMYFEVCV